MTRQEEKDLLLKDLCGRLPYGVKFADPYVKGVVRTLVCFEPDYQNTDYPLKQPTLNGHFSVEEIKPFLRQKSSMTDKEQDTYRNLQADSWVGGGWVVFDTYKSIDYLNSIHVDFRGLIEKGLANVAPEGMYKEGGAS